jgi:hypothetical protein
LGPHLIRKKLRWFTSAHPSNEYGPAHLPTYSPGCIQSVMASLRRSKNRDHTYDLVLIRTGGFWLQRQHQNKFRVNGSTTRPPSSCLDVRSSGLSNLSIRAPRVLSRSPHWSVLDCVPSRIEQIFISVYSSDAFKTPSI